MICFSFVWVKVIFSFYHGRKSPLNHQLGKIFLIFFPTTRSKSTFGFISPPTFHPPNTPNSWGADDSDGTGGCWHCWTRRWGVCVCVCFFGTASQVGIWYQNVNHFRKWPGFVWKRPTLMDWEATSLCMLEVKNRCPRRSRVAMMQDNFLNPLL